MVVVYDSAGCLVTAANADAGHTARLSWPARLATGIPAVRAGEQARRLSVG